MLDAHVALGGEVSEQMAHFVPIRRVVDDFIDLSLHFFIIAEALFLDGQFSPQL